MTSLSARGRHRPTTEHGIGSTVRRRSWLIGCVAFALIAATISINSPVGPIHVIVFIAVGIIANVVVSTATSALGALDSAKLVLATVDGLIAAPMLIVFGPGALVVFVVFAVLPYGFDDVELSSELYPALIGFLYLMSVAVHYIWIGGGIEFMRPIVYAEAIGITIASSLLRRVPAVINQHIRDTTEVMEQAAQGNLTARVASKTGPLAELNSALNTTLDAMARAIEAVEHEADEVGILADALGQAAQGAYDTSDGVATTTETLASELVRQRGAADKSRSISRGAADDAGSLRDRADGVAAHARQLVDLASSGRERVQRTSQTLMDVGEDVRLIASNVQELSGISDAIGGFAATISRIARQTHVLALNAAIEAAHSSSDQLGFSAVADEVRGLAAEAATSAREVTGLIDDVRSGIAAVSRAIQASLEKVHDIEVVSEEAQASLENLFKGARQIHEHVVAAAQTSKDQADRLALVANNMAEIAQISSVSSGRASGAATTMASQKSLIQDLKTVSEQLVAVSDRVRHGVAHFSNADPSDR